MLGGVLPEEARQAYFNTLAANRLVPGEPAEVYDPESQQWLPAKVAALKSSTSDAAWMSFLEKNVVRVEVRKDSGETKIIRVAITPDRVRPVQDPAPQQDPNPGQDPAPAKDPASAQDPNPAQHLAPPNPVPAQAPAPTQAPAPADDPARAQDPADRSPAVTPSKRPPSPEPQEESPSKRQRSESKGSFSKSKGKWRVSDHPEPMTLSISDLIPEESELFSEQERLRVETEKAKKERDEALEQLKTANAERDQIAKERDETMKTATRVAEKAKLFRDQLDKELEDEKQAHGATKAELEKAHDATKAELKIALADARDKETKITDLEREKVQQNAEINKLKSHVTDLRTAKQNAEANLHLIQNRLDILTAAFYAAGLVPAPTATESTVPGRPQLPSLPFPTFPGAPFMFPQIAAAAAATAAAATRPGVVSRPVMPARPRPGMPARPSPWMPAPTRSGASAPSRPGVSAARPQLPGPVVQHRSSSCHRSGTVTQGPSAPATAMAVKPAPPATGQRPMAPERSIPATRPLALAPQPKRLAPLATNVAHGLSVAAHIHNASPTTDAPAAPIVRNVSGSLPPRAPVLTATPQTPAPGPSEAIPGPSVHAPLATEPADTAPVLQALTESAPPPMASDQIPEPPTSSNVDPFGEEPQYSGAKLIAVDVQASWLRSGDAAGWLAAKASMVTEESEKAITALCRRYNRRRSRGKGRDSYRILREDARDFVEVARKTPELGFWPTEKGEVVVVLNRSTEAVWSGKFRTGESAIGQPGKENGSGPAPEQAQSPSEPDVGPGVLPKALESDADRGRSENGGSGSNF